MPTSSLARLGVVGAVVLTASALGGCSALFGTGVERDEDTQQVVEPVTADVFEIRVGDCMNDTGSEQLSDVPIVPCAEPHDSEIYSSFQMPEGDWPGDDAIAAAAETECDAAFEEFIGVPYMESSLYWSVISPSEDGWNRLDDREVFCLVLPESGQSTGSLAGSKQ